MNNRINRSKPGAERLRQRLSPSVKGGASPRRGWTWLRAVSHFLTATTVLRSLTFAIVLIAVVVFVWREVRDDSIYVNPISVPPSLEQRGFTSAALTEEVVARVGRIAWEAGNPKDVPEVRATEDVREIRVAPFGPSLQAVGREIRRALGYSDTRISGAITRTESGWHVSIHNPATHVEAESDVPNSEFPQDAITDAAAIALLRVSNLRLLTQYEYYAWYGTRDPTALRKLEESLDFQERVGGERAAKGVSYTRGLISWARGEFDRAYETYSRLSQKYPTWTKVKSMAATAALSAGRAADANVLLDEIIRSDETDVDTLDVAAETLNDLGRSHDVLGLVARALRIDPADEDPRVSAGEALNNLHRPREAVALLDDWTPATTILFSMSQRVLADAYLALGNVDRVGEIYTLLKRKFPNQFETWHVAGQYAEALGNLGDARASYERMQSDVANGDWFRLQLAKLPIKEGNPRSAIPTLETYLHVHPWDANGHRALADALAATGQFTRADQEFGTVIATDPDNVKALESWADVLTKLGRADESRSKRALAKEAHQRLSVPLDIPELRQFQGGRVAKP